MICGCQRNRPLFSRKLIHVCLVAYQYHNSLKCVYTSIDIGQTAYSYRAGHHVSFPSLPLPRLFPSLSDVQAIVTSRRK